MCAECAEGRACLLVAGAAAQRPCRRHARQRLEQIARLAERGTLRYDFRYSEIATSMKTTATRIGRRGTVVIPAKLRRRFGLEEGSFAVAEERAEGVLIRPAGFLLNNAVSAADYRRARAEVRRMGLDPDAIDHVKPPGV